MRSATLQRLQKKLWRRIIDLVAERGDGIRYEE
jgi:hypothetical protein